LSKIIRMINSLFKVMTSIQDIPAEILALIFEYQPNWFLPILSRVKLCTPYPWNERTCQEAARGGHLEVLKWLRDQDPPIPRARWTC